MTSEARNVAPTMSSSVDSIQPPDGQLRVCPGWTTASNPEAEIIQFRRGESTRGGRLSLNYVCPCLSGEARVRSVPFLVKGAILSQPHL